MNETLISLLMALIPTIILEELAALFWKERSLRLALGVAIVNIITNPTINLLVRFAPDYFFETSLRYYGMIAVLEACVWLSEAWGFWRVLPMKPFRRALLFSLALNATSYSSGFILEWLGYWD